MASTPTHFTPDRREAFLHLIEDGRKIGAACAQVGVSRTTIAKWDARGRAGGGEAGEFAARYAEARELARAHGQAKIEPEFTPPRRERFLTLLEAGRSIEEACADVGIARSTINRWVTNGREGKSSEAIEFHDRFAAVRDAVDAPELTKIDVIRLLERQAKRGSVTAMKLLLERLDREEAGDANDDTAAPVDPFDALEQGATVTQLRVPGRTA